jgi:hypothetical protein
MHSQDIIRAIISFTPTQIDQNVIIKSVFESSEAIQSCFVIRVAQLTPCSIP